ncbi:hypothetical protein L596_001911 [Steinernema carpocapsae]|uniref:Uncharacterized protein n=1 Tax=Steinernema carpocapsae TaxID=34508 RepID=A0A4U8UPN7_STECR|nr:hypothetical protein L596_001908 [Steinernema carpocapsae]TMS34285.1 hypothetical protein L596_001911 [Steinernema carpocapsae]
MQYLRVDGGEGGGAQKEAQLQCMYTIGEEQPTSAATSCGQQESPLRKQLETGSCERRTPALGEERRSAGGTQ